MAKRGRKRLIENSGNNLRFQLVLQPEAFNLINELKDLIESKTLVGVIRLALKELDWTTKRILNGYEVWTIKPGTEEKERLPLELGRKIILNLPPSPIDRKRRKK